MEHFFGTFIEAFFAERAYFAHTSECAKVSGTTAPIFFCVYLVELLPPKVSLLQKKAPLQKNAPFNAAGTLFTDLFSTPNMKISNEDVDFVVVEAQKAREHRTLCQSG